ncbi:hypothetical protein RHSIM_Rhsim09G0076900 [Rhododendron simsii]|uniref:Uncharacterized protein n=1 Tax=Rhododendron simsii TaxID=118357 RepID=A0A834LGR7_RHOSS|nr:hypothetical protein RHSIM_Rhsim09G0076900 [Rhododendron simsii]
MTSSSSTTALRDSGKAPAVEAAILGGVSSTRVLRSSCRTPTTGGSSFQPNPPQTKFEAPFYAGNEALSPFNVATYVPQVHIIGRGGSLRYRPHFSDLPLEVLHSEPEQYFGFTNAKANEKLRMWGAIPGLVLDVTGMADKKIEALTAKVNVLAELVAALSTIVHSLQRSPPQAPPPPPPTRWMKRAAQRETYPAKDNQIEMVVDDLQQQHEKQLLLDTVGLNQESLKAKNSCKMNMSNNNVELVGSHLNHKQKRKFVPLGMNLQKVFYILEEKGALKPL